MAVFYIMPRYTITGTVTYSSQANRDAARTRLDTALSAFTYAGFTSGIGTGVTNSGTTAIIVSIESTIDGIETASALANSLSTALTSTNRWTSGALSVNTIP